MSETRKDPSDRALLGALREWPEVPVSEQELDVKSAKIAAKATTDALASRTVDEKLLGAPLPSLPEEGHNSAPSSSASPKRSSSGPSQGGASMATAVEGSKMTVKTERERRSFQDLARMANTPPPASVRSTPPSAPPSGVMRATEAAASDSGVVDLKLAAASDPSAAARAAQTPLAAAGIFEDEDSRRSQPPGQRFSSAPPSMPVSAPVSAAVSASEVPSLAQQSVATPKKKGGGLILGAGVVALAAMAAGGVFFIKAQQAKKAAQVVALANAPTPDIPPPPPAAAPVAQAPAATDPQSLAADDKADDTAKRALAGKVAMAKGGASKANAGEPKADKPAVDPKLVAKDLPTAPGPASGELSDAMKAAAGSSGQQDNNALQQIAEPQFAPGSVPQKPSQGAVTGAIGSVLPGARACLKADDPVSRATITFGSTGTVQGVTVSGAAAGKPAEACIKGALGKAKVPPFAQPTYSTPVTVRPN